MKRKTISLTLTIVLCYAVLCVVAACKTEKTSVETITIGTTASIEKAVRGEYNYDMLASGNSELPLVWQDAEGEFHPLLASFSTTDSTTWTYTIVDGMTWSDGQAVTAADILFTLQYDDASDGGTNFVGENPKYVSYSISEDGKAISLTLSATNVRELSNMTFFRVMPKHIYENKTSDQITQDDARVVCGPYVLQSFDKNSGTLTYAVNRHYPQKPNVEKLVYRLFANEDAMYLALQNGDIDAVWAYSTAVAQTYAEVLENNSDITLLNVAATNAPAVLMFNTSVAPFNDVNVRNAVSYALDYELFKATFGGVGASVANRGFVPQTTVGYKKTEQNTQNLQKATELLAQSGYTKGKSDWFEKGGDILEFNLTVRSTKAEHLRYAELVKTNLESFGIKVNIDSVDGNTFNIKTSNKFAGENNTTVSMQAAINGFTAAGMGMVDGLGTIYVNKNHAVQGGCQVNDEKFAQILSEMSAAKTPEEYNAAAAKMQDYYAENTPMIALFWKNMTFAHSAKLQGFVIDAAFGINNIQSWFSVTAAD